MVHFGIYPARDFADQEVHSLRGGVANGLQETQQTALLWSTASMGDIDVSVVDRGRPGRRRW